MDNYQIGGEILLLKASGFCDGLKRTRKKETQLERQSYLYIGLFGGNHPSTGSGETGGIAPTVDVINNPICHFSALGHYF